MIGIHTLRPTAVLDQLRALETVVPRELVQLADVATALHEASAEDPTARVRASILDGTITADEAVALLRDTAMARVVHDNSRAVIAETESAFHQRCSALLAANAAEIIVHMRPAFDEAARQLAEAVSVAGTTPVKGVASPAVACAIADRQAAVHRLDQVKLARWMIARACGRPESSTYFVSPDNQLDAAQLQALTTRWTDLVGSGIKLALLTDAEVDVLVADAERRAHERHATETAERLERDQVGARRAAAWERARLGAG